MRAAIPGTVHDPNYIANSEVRSQGRAVRPKDAATLILVRREGRTPKILMGKRAAGHAFMPGKFVFPGGKVDRGDSRLRPPADLNPAVLRRLMDGCSEARARALAIAAIRETYEETGLMLGERESPTLRTRSPHWQGFVAQGINPRLDTLHYIARAITPPYRNRRFDARFFMAVPGNCWSFIGLRWTMRNHLICPLSQEWCWWRSIDVCGRGTRLRTKGHLYTSATARR